MQKITGYFSIADGNFRLGVIETTTGAFSAEKSIPDLRTALTYGTATGKDSLFFNSSYVTRNDANADVTRTKQKGVKYIIKVL